MLTARFEVNDLDAFCNACKYHHIAIIAVLSMNEEIIMVTVLAERAGIECLIDAGFTPKDVTDE